MGEFADMALEAGMDEWMELGEGFPDYDYRPDPLYYHNYYEGTSIQAETEKAYLIKFNDGDMAWVAKSLCKKVKKDSLYIWQGTEFKIMKGL